MNTTTSRPRRSRLPGLLLSVALIALVVAGVWAVARRRSPAKRSADREAPVFVVKRGPLTISVTEAGTIKNREQVVIKSEVEGSTTILSLIEEGTFVKKGDPLVELDASRLQDGKTSQEISAQNAEAGFIRARENLAVAKSQAASDVSKAKLATQFAKEDLRKYIEGEYPQELKEAGSKITIAEEELKRAQDRLTWSDKLAEERYLSRTELDADVLAAKKAELELELAKGRRGLLVEYTNARRLAELKSDVEQAEMALERAQRKATADVVQAEAELKAKELQFKREKGTLEKIERQLAKCKITAPVEGMVVYATTGKGSWRGNQEPLEEGRQVREREELIYLPTAASMMAEVKVHESSLEKVAAGMPVRVTVDALPGKTYWGEVAKIGLLPDAQMMWMNPDLKVYSTEVNLDGDASELRAGMTCRAEIIVKELDDAAYVPVQAVLRVGGSSVVYLPREGGPEMRVVERGLDNNRMIVIRDGLEPGEAVLMTPPLAAAEAPVAEAAEAGTRQRPQRPERKKPETKPVAAGEADSGRQAEPTGEPPDKGVGQASLDELVKKFRDMPREQRRQWIEGLPEDQKAKLFERMRAMGGGRGGPGGGSSGRGGGGGPSRGPRGKGE